MKLLLLIILLCISTFGLYSQIDEYTDIDNDVSTNKEMYINTNIGKASLVFYCGVGLMPFSGKLSDYFNANFGGAMSLDYFSSNNLAFSISIMGTDSKLKKEFVDNDNSWVKGDKMEFWSYGVSMGYSVLNKPKWKITPLGGVVLSQSKLISSDETQKYEIGPKFSPAIGLNFTYRFINIEKNKSYSSGVSSCMGINARITYVPFAVYGKGIPFSGGVWYMTLGINLVDLFQNY